MRKNKKVTENDDLRVIQSSVDKLLHLDEQQKKIHRALEKEINTIHYVLNRFCDDRNIKERIRRDQEVSLHIQEIKNLISTLRALI